MDKKFDLYHQLDQMLTEDAAVIPLYYPSLKYLIKPDGSGCGESTAPACWNLSLFYV